MQCCPDALGSCDYNEVLGTDGGREGAEHWLCLCPDPLPARHALGCCVWSPTLAQPRETWAQRKAGAQGLGWAPGQREGAVQRCHCDSILLLG